MSFVIRDWAPKRWNGAPRLASADQAAVLAPTLALAVAPSHDRIVSNAGPSSKKPRV